MAATRSVQVREWLRVARRSSPTLLVAVVVGLSLPGPRSLFAQPEMARIERGPVLARIAAPLAGDQLVLTTTRRVAGAVDSVTWRGREFIDSFDHGRQLQSASNFDVGSPFTPETFNPTEAGSRSDGRGASSTSRLLHQVVGERVLQTTTQMAFWLRPGETSQGNPAKNPGPLSNHLLTKRIQLGYRGLEQVIQYDVTFSVPVGELHRYAQFEAVTGYMPAEFGRFWALPADSDQLQPLSDGPGEQRHPVILATDDGRYAMGVYSPDQPSAGFEQAGYGRFRFLAQRVTKWNCVFRVRRPGGVAPGDYRFRTFVLVGDLELVRSGIVALRGMRHVGRRTSSGADAQ